MQQQYRTLEIQNDQNFIYLKSSNDIEPTLITKIAPPSQAITGYELRVLLGPTVSDVINEDSGYGTLIDISQQRGIGFAYRYIPSGTINPPLTTKYEPYTRHEHEHDVNYSNFIYNIIAGHTSIDRFHLVYDPNKTIYNDAISNDLIIQSCPKILKFVYVQNFTPTQFLNSSQQMYAQKTGSYWLLENITLLSNTRLGGSQT